MKKWKLKTDAYIGGVIHKVGYEFESDKDYSFVAEQIDSNKQENTTSVAKNKAKK